MSLSIPSSALAKLAHFTGRSRVTARLVDWFENTQSRHFLITGEPGAGKSTLMAWLAAGAPTDVCPASSSIANLCSRISAVHFCAAATGNCSPQAFAQTVAEQLSRNIIGFDEAMTEALKDRIAITSVQNIERAESVTGIHIGHIELGSLEDEAAFNRSLREPLRILYNNGYDAPLVLLVDGLDESMSYTGRYGLARALANLDGFPPHVRAIISTRPDQRVLMHFRTREHYDLVADAATDDDDIAAYVNKRTDRGDGRSHSELGQLISKKAQGNFLYADLATNALLEQPFPDDAHESTLDALPAGLGGLYHMFLQRDLGADDERWHRQAKPLLGCIAVAEGDGFSRSQLESICGLDDALPNLRACSQFLEGRFPDGPFRTFHRSFNDFLFEDASNEDFHIDAKWAHSKVAEYYLQDTHRWLEDAGYAPRHLTLHLRAAEKVTVLTSLVNDHAWNRAQMNLDPGGALLINDIFQAWIAAEEAVQNTIEHGRASADVVEEIRCAFRVSAAYMRSRYLPADLLVALVQYSVWTPVQALTAASLCPDSQRQQEAFAALVPVVCPGHVNDLIRIVGSIQPPSSRRTTYTQVLKQLVDFVPKTVEALGSLDIYLDRTVLLNEYLSLLAADGHSLFWHAVGNTPSLNSYLNESQRSDSSNAAAGGGDRLPTFDEEWNATLAKPAEEASCYELDLLLDRFADDVRGVKAEDAFRFLAGIPASAARTDTLARLVPLVAPDLRTEIVDDIIAWYKRDGDVCWRFRELILLLDHVPQPVWPRISQAVLAIVRAMEDPLYGAMAMAELACKLPDAERDPLLREAIEMTSRPRRARSEFVLGELRFGRERATTEEPVDYSEKAAALARVADVMPETCRGPILREALVAVRNIPSQSNIPVDYKSLLSAVRDLELALLDPSPGRVGLQWDSQASAAQATALRALIPSLDDDLLNEAVQVAEAMTDGSATAKTFRLLAERLLDPTRGRLLQQAVSLVIEIPDDLERAQQLLALLPMLPAPIDEVILREARDAALAIDDPTSRGELAAGLAKFLPTEERRRVLEHGLLAGRIAIDMKDVLATVTAVIPHLPVEHRAPVIQEWLESWRHSVRDPDLLVDIAPYIPGNLVSKAMMSTIDLGKDRLRCVAALLPAMPVDGRLKELETAVGDAISHFGNDYKEDWHRSDCRLYHLLAASLIADKTKAEAYIQHALAHAYEFNDPDDRANALSDMVPLLSATAASSVLRDFVDALFQAKSYRRNAILSKLLPCLTEEQLCAMMERATSFEDGWEMVTLLEGRMRPSLVQNALELAGGARENWARAEAIAAILPAIPADQRDSQLQRFLASLGDDQDSDVIARVAAFTDVATRSESRRYLNEQALDALYGSEIAAQILTTWIPHIPENERAAVAGDAFKMAAEIDSDSSRRSALTKLSRSVADLKLATVHRLFSRTLKRLAARSYDDLMSDLQALAPVIARIGGPRCIANVVDSIWALVKSLDVRNYYDVLGVAPDATTVEIKSAHRRIIADIDRSPDRESPEEWRKDVDEAVAVLSDPVDRVRHDANLDRKVKGDFPERYKLGLEELGHAVNRMDDDAATAITYCNKALQYGARISLVYRIRGECFGSLGNSDRALADFTHALKLDPDNIDLYRKRGMMYRAIGMDTLAAADLRSALRVRIKKTMRAIVAVLSRVFPSVAPPIRCAAAIAGLFVIPINVVAAGLEPEWMRYDVLLYYMPLLIGPCLIGIALLIANARAMVQVRSKNREQQIVMEISARFSWLIAWGLFLVVFYQCRTLAGGAATAAGVRWIENNKNDTAISALTQGIRLDPKLSRARMWRGLAHYNKDEYPAAIIDLTKAIQLDPRDSEAYVLRGWVFEATNDIDRAIADYSIAIAIRPTSSTYASRAKCYSEQRDDERAEADLKEAERLNPASAGK